jgi:hypothetical protein
MGHISECHVLDGQRNDAPRRPAVDRPPSVRVSDTVLALIDKTLVRTVQGTDMARIGTWIPAGGGKGSAKSTARAGGL